MICFNQLFHMTCFMKQVIANAAKQVIWFHMYCFMMLFLGDMFKIVKIIKLNLLSFLVTVRWPTATKQHFAAWRRLRHVPTIQQLPNCSCHHLNHHPIPNCSNHHLNHNRSRLISGRMAVLERYCNLKRRDAVKWEDWISIERVAWDWESGGALVMRSGHKFGGTLHRRNVELLQHHNPYQHHQHHQQLRKPDFRRNRNFHSISCGILSR